MQPTSSVVIDFPLAWQNNGLSSPSGTLRQSRAAPLPRAATAHPPLAAPPARATWTTKKHGIFAASKEVHFLKVLLQCETDLELSKLLLTDKTARSTARRFGYLKSIRQTPTTPIQEAQAAPPLPAAPAPVQPITSSHAKRQTTRRARRKKKAIILRLRDAFIEILKIKRWKHMQDIWTEHMRYDLDVKRTTAIFASALEIDTEPSTEHPHAIENLPITEPEPLKTKEPRANAIDIVPPPAALETPTKELAPPSDDDSAKSAGRSEKRRRARRGSSSSAPAQAVQAKLPGTKHATT